MRNDAEFREAVRRVVDLVLTEDYAYVDSLADRVQDELVTPLQVVSDLLDAESGIRELEIAVGVVESAASAVSSDLPSDLREMIEALRFAGRRKI